MRSASFFIPGVILEEEWGRKGKIPRRLLAHARLGGGIEEGEKEENLFFTDSMIEPLVSFNISFENGGKKPFPPSHLTPRRCCRSREHFDIGVHLLLRVEERNRGGAYCDSRVRRA